MKRYSAAGTALEIVMNHRHNKTGFNDMDMVSLIQALERATGDVILYDGITMTINNSTIIEDVDSLCRYYTQCVALTRQQRIFLLMLTKKYNDLESLFAAFIDRYNVKGVFMYSDALYFEGRAFGNVEAVKEFANGKLYKDEFPFQNTLWKAGELLSAIDLIGTDAPMEDFILAVKDLCTVRVLNNDILIGKGRYPSIATVKQVFERFEILSSEERESMLSLLEGCTTLSVAFNTIKENFNILGCYWKNDMIFLEGESFAAVDELKMYLASNPAIDTDLLSEGAEMSFVTEDGNHLILDGVACITLNPKAKQESGYACYGHVEGDTVVWDRIDDARYETVDTTQGQQIQVLKEMLDLGVTSIILQKSIRDIGMEERPYPVAVVQGQFAFKLICKGAGLR